jgi:hypothetical protein
LRPAVHPFAEYLNLPEVGETALSFRREFVLGFGAGQVRGLLAVSLTATLPQADPKLIKLS